MNVRSDDGYGDQMQTHQQKPIDWASICCLCESDTMNVPLHFVRGQLYRSNIMSLQDEVIFRILTFLYV